MSNPFYHPMSTTTVSKTLKILLSLMTALTFGLVFTPQLVPWLALSKEGIQHFFYWQWITYSLFEPSTGGITFPLVLQLGFSLYLLWIFGSSLLARLNSSRFLGLFLGSAFVGGVISWVMLLGLNSPELIVNSTPALYACLFAWTILNADAQVLVFFAIPFNACRALYVFLGITLLTELSHGHWPAAAALVASVIYAYFFVLFSCRILSPFSWLHPLERALIRWKGWPQKSSKPYRSTKIYDIHSGKPILDDEQFMDAMLTRISLYGEETLSPEDRKRMEQISRNKRKR